jgi:hypothetical protein
VFWPGAAPQSSMASFAAATAMRESTFMRRIFIAGMNSFGLKSRTSAALCAVRPAVSKRSTSATAVSPEASSARNASTPIAPGAMTPMPVTGMREDMNGGAL